MVASDKGTKPFRVGLKGSVATQLFLEVSGTQLGSLLMEPLPPGITRGLWWFMFYGVCAV